MDANYTLILICPLKRTLKTCLHPNESFSVLPGKPTLSVDTTGAEQLHDMALVHTLELRSQELDVFFFT